MSDMNKEAKCETRGEVLADGHPSRSERDYGAAGRRKTKLAGQRPVLPAVGGARMDENLAKLKPIKVNQGDVLYD